MRGQPSARDFELPPSKHYYNDDVLITLCHNEIMKAISKENTLLPDMKNITSICFFFELLSKSSICSLENIILGVKDKSCSVYISDIWEKGTKFRFNQNTKQILLQLIKLLF